MAECRSDLGDILPEFSRSSVWPHLRPFRYNGVPEKPSAGIGGIGMTSRRRLSSTGPTSSGRQTCQDVQTHQSIARCISVNPGSTCRWPPGPGRAGDWAGTNRRPAAAATTDRFDGGVGAVSIRSVDRRPLGQLLTGFCRPSLVLLAALASGWPRHLTRSATGGRVAVGRPGRVQQGPDLLVGCLPEVTVGLPDGHKQRRRAGADHLVGSLLQLLAG